MAAKPSSPFLFLLPLLALLIVANAHGLSSITKVCTRAAKYDAKIDVHFCTNALKAVPESHRTELKGILKITTRLALIRTTTTADLISRWSSVACSDLARTELRICASAYAQAAMQLKASKAACAARSFGKLGQLMLVSGGLELCQAGLEKSGHESLLSRENSDLQQLLQMYRAFTYFVNKHNRA